MNCNKELFSVKVTCRLVAMILALGFSVAVRAGELDELKALIEAQRQMIEAQSQTIQQLQQRVDQIESIQQEALQETQVPMATDYDRPPVDPAGNILFRRQTAQDSAEPPVDPSGTLIEPKLAEDDKTPSAEAVAEAAPPAEDAAAGESPEPEVVAGMPTIPSGDLLDGVVMRGDFPFSIRIPDSDISFLIDGYIKVDAMYDSDEIGRDGRFFPDTIAVENAGNGETRLTAQQSRFGILAQKPSPLGRMTGYFEGDFYGSGTQNFRLRHAYGEIGRFLGGKTWSTFMDPAALPNTVALTAPSGVIFKRPALLRWSQPLGERWKARFALEEPNTDVTLPQGGEDVKRYPNFISTVGYAVPERGHVQLGGILRRPGYEDASGNKDFVTGWGLSLTGTARLFERDKLGLGLIYGDGIGNYIGGFATSRTGAGLSSSGDLKSLRSYGAYASYQHFWTTDWKSTLAYGIADVDNASGMPGGSVERTQTATANLIWSPLEHFGVGIEYLYGKRENENGNDGDNHRVQTSVQFGF